MSKLNKFLLIQFYLNHILPKFVLNLFTIITDLVDLKYKKEIMYNINGMLESILINQFINYYK